MFETIHLIEKGPTNAERAKYFGMAFEVEGQPNETA